MVRCAGVRSRFRDVKSTSCIRGGLHCKHALRWPSRIRHAADVTLDTRPGLLHADALTALLVLRPRALPRNRHFALYATDEATIARRRAGRLRSLVRQLTGALGPAKSITLEPSSGQEFLLRYSLSRVSLSRSLHISPSDLSVLRMALLESGARLLPAPLVAREGDRTHVRVLLEAVSAHEPSAQPLA